MLRFYFAKPPLIASLCYLVGFTGIGIAMAHHWIPLTWWELVRNQQLFIASAIIVAVGSIFNWLLPVLAKLRSNDDS